MKKVVRRQTYMLTLPGLLLLVAFLIGGGAEALVGELPTAAAAGVHEAGGDPRCSEEQGQPSFGSAVVVTSGEVICSALTSFGGTTVIRGEVRGDVVSFGGSVIIDGVVDGNVILYGGNLTLQNAAHINGDIHVCGGQWTEGTDSHLHGSVFDCPKSVSLLLADDGGPGFHFWSTLTWIALAMLLTTLLPEHVMLVRTTARSKMRRSLVLGLLSVFLAPAVLAVLIALIIPIPLAIIVAVGLIAAWALGTVAVSWLVGDYIMRRVAPHQNTRPLQVVVGSIVLALAGSLPYVGWFISIGVGLLGLGAVFLSRFGTRLYSQPKQPLPL
ncbi:MAG TPA: polymer-forming cytoskeletal protein [Ktedonosporobacter sp.]|nr:polymer-forming cytoskeletal protein [Ktedonosporobacter sp.]